MPFHEATLEARHLDSMHLLARRQISHFKTQQVITEYRVVYYNLNVLFVHDFYVE